MSFAPGVRVGPYEIVAPLGSGGMGQVWRARDTRLNREVAIKTSAAMFSDRFEREARAIAALNHPHICQIYDVGKDYIVMELVDGAPVKGPLPLDQALKLAIQLASALEAAHRGKVTHRDLKPANILNTRGGIKVLDFGLAKVEEKKVAGPDDATFARGLTQEGAMVGTLQYMAPEQVQGREVDSRVDIFSFGCVLYEMLTGKRAFDGANAASVIGAVLERPAPSVSEIAPAALDRVLKKCLAKDPEDRWQSARDLKDELEWIAGGGGIATAATAPSRARLATNTALIALGLALAGLAFVHFRETPPVAPVVRFTVGGPDKGSFALGGLGIISGAVSPDGSKIAFPATGEDGKEGIWLRSLDTAAPQPIPGTEGGLPGCWSPDGKALGYFAANKLKRIDIAGGAAVTLADAPAPRGCSWNREGVILFTPNPYGPVYRVSASGGAAVAASAVNKAARTVHRFPVFLPDGKHFLYTQSLAVTGGQVGIEAGSLDSPGEDRKLMDADSFALYSQGYLLFLRGNTLMGRPFDAAGLVFTGDPVPVAQQVQNSPNILSVGAFSVSANGWLVYQGGAGAPDLRLTWLDRAGKRLGALGDPDSMAGAPHFSPDRKNVAVSAGDTSGGNRDVWIYDVLRGLRTRFTFDPAVDGNPVWSPDGKTIVFRSTRKGPGDLFRKPSDGSANEEMLFADDTSNKLPTSFAPDGRFLACYCLGDPKTGNDILILPDPLGRAGASKPFPFMQTEFNESDGQFAPDGKWIAYQSNESGRAEIYLAPFPGPGGKKQVSSEGGVAPRWRADGKELFFVAGDQLMAAEIGLAAGAQVGAVHPLFSGATGNYDVAADGQRFLFVMRPEGKPAEPLTVVQNWTAGLKK